MLDRGLVAGAPLVAAEGDLRDPQSPFASGWVGLTDDSNFDPPPRGW